MYGLIPVVIVVVSSLLLIPSPSSSYQKVSQTHTNIVCVIILQNVDDDKKKRLSLCVGIRLSQPKRERDEAMEQIQPFKKYINKWCLVTHKLFYLSYNVTNNNNDNLLQYYKCGCWDLETKKICILPLFLFAIYKLCKI